MAPTEMQEQALSLLWPGSADHECAMNPALHGCETFDFAPADLPLLRDRLCTVPAFSVHAPLPTPPGYPGSPVTSFLLDPDPVKRLASMDMLHQTIQLAAAWERLTPCALTRRCSGR